MLVDLVSYGHNVYYGGIGGCGKTYVAKNFIEILKRKNVNFASCPLYDESNAQTIHAFSGIGQCRGTRERLLKNILTIKIV